MSTFSLTDRDGKEFQDRSLRFEGWGLSAQFVLASDITDNPTFVPWRNWTDYRRENKSPQPVKWIAFKNERANITEPDATLDYAAEVRVQTLGVNSDNTGQLNDRVDFTEYAEWFDVLGSEAVDIGILDPLASETVFSGVLFDAGPRLATNPTATGISDILGYPENAFDDDDFTKVALRTVPMYVWRTFGTPVGVSGEVSVTVSGRGGLFTTSADVFEEYVMDYEEVVIDGFELELDRESPGIPNTIEFQVLSGIDPTQDSNWHTIFEDTDLAVTITGSPLTTLPVDNAENIEDILFNAGEPYIIQFNERVTTSGVRILITDAEANDSSSETVSISRFRILQSDGASFTSAVLSNDPEVKEGGRRSLKITYLSGGSDPAKVRSAANFELDPDPKWSVQDFLSFYLRIDRPDLLDFENSYIRIGRDSNTFYEWDLSSLQGDTDSVELKKHLLRFFEAPEKGEGELSENYPDRVQLESQVNFKEGPLGFFELEVKPLGEAPEDINIWLDNLDVTRENFTLPGKFGNTLYLNNSELIYYPISAFDMSKGYIEMVITPDWNQRGRTTLAVEEAFTLFTIVNDAEESFSAFYEKRSGLVFASTSGDTRTIMQVGFLTAVEKNKPFKIGVAWDSEGRRIDARSGANLRLFVNDNVIGDYLGDWKITPTKTAYLFIGSRAYQSDLAFNPNQFQSELSGVVAKFIPETFSITGGVENLLVSSEPRQVVFAERQLLKDKILISLDGVTYVSASDTSLPFIVQGIPHGDSVDVWIKTNLPKDTTNLARLAFLNTRWKTK